MEKLYPYAVAKIRVKEGRLLTKANLENLASEKSINRIVSVLRERGYDFDLVSRYEDYGIVLNKKQEELYQLVREIIDEKDVVDIFLSKNDYYNIKLILKSQIENKDYQENLVGTGSIAKEEMAKMMEEENYDKLDNTTKNAIAQAKQMYEKTKMPFVIDAILDKACFHKMKKLADMIGNEFIQNYLVKLIDITNIQAFFRIRKMEKDPQVFEISYLTGGKISLKTFMENFKEDDPNLKDKFLGFSDTIEQAIYHDKNLDKFCDNYLMNYMKEAKLRALTIEPIVAYIYAKKTEFKNIRIIFTGKLNGISPEKIKERLRESYV